MERESPLVSVVIPYYNNDNEAYLRACFGSVLNQTHAPVELIVVDDGSTEEAAAMLDMLQPEYGFRLIRQKNKGVSAALNEGLKQATGKYLAFMGADDYWASGRLAAQVAFLEAAPATVAACCSRGYYVFENDPARPDPVLTRLLSKEDVGFDRLLQRNHILAISVMIRASVMEELGGFDPKSVIEDWDMWLRITDRYEMAFLPEPLAYYRRHGHNHSNGLDKKSYDSVKYLLGKWKNKPGYSAAIAALELSAMNNFSRFQKMTAVKVAFRNTRYVTRWLYWRGLFKIFIPSFFFDKKYR
ncbi:MAG TPA: glycosyltransferase [Panacibacter sp.]|nr:glycosyltransferase [Panacibacter sp.]HNP46533.1 glycosyltransferase [Panacibacter sp.]